MKKKSEPFRQRFRELTLVEFDPRELSPAGVDWKSVECLLRAADVADDIFWRQVLGDTDRSSLLARAGDDEELKEIILFNYGPSDCLDNGTIFLSDAQKFPGGGFYPPDLSREEFSNYIQSHPDCRASFESPYTVIRRSNSHLKAIYYHDAYRDEVRHLSDLLVKAATLAAPHTPFRRFLNQRAKDVLTDEYYESDSLWVSITENPVDIVIGPYEVYEDQLLGIKAAYEAKVLVRDFEETAKMQQFKSQLPSLCRHLEPELCKFLEVDDERLELSVANLIYAGGYARKAIPAIAFSLPNDEQVIEEVGSRQTILKNVLEAKFHFIAWPIYSDMVQNSGDDKEAAFRDFFNHTLFHEIAHSTGPQRITKDGELTTVNRSLKQYYSVLEEAKADVLGACFMLNMGSELSSPRFLDIYVSGFLRAIRFGLSNAHGGGSAIQFNFLLQERAIAVNPKTDDILVNHSSAQKAIYKLTSKIIDIQERGDFEAAQDFVSTYCVISPEISKFLERVKVLPRDIRIQYKAYS